MARQFARSSKRTVSWAQGVVGTDLSLSATGKQLWTTAIGSVGAALKRTIVRTRGAAIVTLKTATAGGDGFTIGLGIGLVTLQAHTAGVTSVPGPLTDTDWDGWLYHAVGHVFATTATIADGVNAAGAVARFDIDSKAMRKFDEDADILIGVIEVTEHGTATAEFQANTRILLKQG